MYLWRCLNFDISVVYLPVRLLICPVLSSNRIFSHLIWRALRWNCGRFFPSATQKEITGSWDLGPSFPSWGIMTKTTAIRRSNPFSFFVYVMSLTCNLWWFWWGDWVIFNKMNSECSWEWFIVFFCCCNFKMCVCWEEKERYVVIFCTELFQWWTELVCW